jgi:hypothetical protein
MEDAHWFSSTYSAHKLGKRSCFCSSAIMHSKVLHFHPFLDLFLSSEFHGTSALSFSYFGFINRRGQTELRTNSSTVKAVSS